MRNVEWSWAVMERVMCGMGVFVPVPLQTDDLRLR